MPPRGAGSVPARPAGTAPGKPAAGGTAPSGAAPGGARHGRPWANALGPYLAVLTLLVTGLAVVSRGGWRWGLDIVAAGLVLAAALRITLPARRAGLLVVRGRTFDAIVLLSLAVVLVLFTAIDPASRN